MLKSSEALDSVYRALAEPNRRSMVKQLSQRGRQSVSELKAPLSISLPAVMQHLDVLTESGLVLTYKEGGSRYCELQSAALDEAQQWIMRRRASLERRLDRLGQHLEASKGKKKK
jgi:DNA-binding transcriptional ArsR family regulator